MLADALAPELVIVGGIYGYATDLLETGMWAAFTAEGHAQIVNRTKIVAGRRGREVGSYASCPVALAGLPTSMATAGGSCRGPAVRVGRAVPAGPAAPG